MKTLTLLLTCFLGMVNPTQKHTPLPHGMVFGTKPDTRAMLKASAVEAFMGKKTRISTTISGLVIKVNKTKGGWFDVDAGNGKIIAAHFQNYSITIPEDLKGKFIIAEGVAAKQFIADDLQHLAGDTVSGKKQHSVKTDPKQRLTFEVKGLMVDH
jgi:hypothetical protein